MIHRPCPFARRAEKSILGWEIVAFSVVVNLVELLVCRYSHVCAQPLKVLGLEDCGRLASHIFNENGVAETSLARQSASYPAPAMDGGPYHMLPGFVGREIRLMAWLSVNPTFLHYSPFWAAARIAQ